EGTNAELRATKRSPGRVGTWSPSRTCMCISVQDLSVYLGAMQNLLLNSVRGAGALLVKEIKAAQSHVQMELPHVVASSIRPVVDTTVRSEMRTTVLPDNHHHDNPSRSSLRLPPRVILPESNASRGCALKVIASQKSPRYIKVMIHRRGNN
ncbi:hypothetical protein SK128_021749, partial [Halocaridina rubra]